MRRTLKYASEVSAELCDMSIFSLSAPDHPPTLPMYALKSIAVLSALLLAGLSGATKKTTTIGIETEEGSKSMQVPFGECHHIEEEEVRSVFLSRECRFFSAMGCTGRTTLLMPGEHSSSEPVPVSSVYCEDKVF
ncbi:hypothetical protein BO71DRAFT_198972 [Aspergillus ellipticus CBS 707.79]|uniref:Uncharacterized protein n=1 Tax=Aspergillus ellipticus CBS 707.79 TaxID=1448320 RepID=A0A319DEA6_9EURO|nr:hypothetical protein BO71DRAFT_198972 [Aspergillus ellipticus CBS 707.79]